MDSDPTEPYLAELAGGTHPADSDFEEEESIPSPPFSPVVRPRPNEAPPPRESVPGLHWFLFILSDAHWENY
ncbi:hypothetical protein LINPERHAP1_LOCUS31497 [Linum perenne]